MRTTKWPGEVTEYSKSGDPAKIAASLQHSAETSKRRDVDAQLLEEPRREKPECGRKTGPGKSQRQRKSVVWKIITVPAPATAYGWSDASLVISIETNGRS